MPESHQTTVRWEYWYTFHPHVPSESGTWWPNFHQVSPCDLCLDILSWEGKDSCKWQAGPLQLEWDQAQPHLEAVWHTARSDMIAMWGFRIDTRMLTMCKCKGVIIQITDPDTDHTLIPGVKSVGKWGLEQRHTTTLQLLIYILYYIVTVIKRSCIHLMWRWLTTWHMGFENKALDQMTANNIFDRK